MGAFADKQFSVIRRYSDFTWLRDTLKQQLPGVIVPPLPEKAVMNNFSPEFIESRCAIEEPPLPPPHEGSGPSGTWPLLFSSTLFA